MDAGGVTKMFRSMSKESSRLRAGTFFLLCAFLIGPSAHARSIEEAIDDLGTRLGRQLANQQVGSFGALQFTNLDGSQTEREKIVADGIARRIGRAGSQAIYIGLDPSESARAKFALPPGANIAGHTAARIAKLAGADAMMVGTLRRIDSETIELVGQVFSAQRGINLADAHVTFTESRVAKAVVPVPPVEPMAPIPRAQAPASIPEKEAHSATPEVATAEVGQFLIELHGCTRTLAGVDCAFVLRNQSDNVVFAIAPHGTRLFDDQGREYEPGMSKIADTRLDLAGPYRRYLKKQVIGGVPTRASIRFPKVANDARRIASLQLNVAAPGWAKAEFRDVPILGSAQGN